MAHLWIPENDEWTAHGLADGVLPLPATMPSLPSGVVLRSAGPDADWYLLAMPPTTVRVNGQAPALGIRVLRDKDEIRVPGAPPMFFSSEKLVSVEPFTGEPGATCIRCTKVIEPQSPAVRCGSCQRWYHQNPERNCFTYGDGAICVECGAAAVVNDAFRWTPEEL